MTITRIFHGAITPEDIARDLTAYFNRGNYQVQRFGQGDNLAVQIATRQSRSAGGHTALTANIQKVADGISVALGNQVWFGLAASLGMTALSALRNPLSILGRLDDLAQDVESAQLAENVWQVIESTAQKQGTGVMLSERLARTVCPYCLTANVIAADRCVACGAPLGEVQPRTCGHCGFVVRMGETNCPNCHQAL
ncbi:MAG TPA: zinc ribbon domain-containing protein [Anaerolineaceae bacterium]|jgi:RNase P subunit RPR2|nr:zinc ribbon domain-containing protein [Anaerolineaceae bacterium]